MNHLNKYKQSRVATHLAALRTSQEAADDVDLAEEVGVLGGAADGVGGHQMGPEGLLGRGGEGLRVGAVGGTHHGAVVQAAVGHGGERGLQASEEVKGCELTELRAD